MAHCMLLLSLLLAVAVAHSADLNAQLLENRGGPPQQVLDAVELHNNDEFPVVNTASGPVRGYVASGVQVFAGIPYAAPPVGPLRFRAPQPHAPWTSTRDAMTFGSICPQMRILSGLYLGQEDCLFLNVYVPDSPSTKPRAVMFWIYGGGFSLGDGWEFGAYDGKNLAAGRDVIVVTANYRLGPLGFLALEELMREDPDGSTGNYGVMDQRLALKWVQQNIAAFGGDPKQVTIFGESAGGMSVCYHLSSPASAGLFSGAIMESGNCEDTGFFQPLVESVSFNNMWSNAAGCNFTGDALLACLRNMSVSTIQDAIAAMGDATWPGPYHGFVPPMTPVFTWGPSIDGTKVGLLDAPIKLLRAGQINNASFMLGTDNDEGSMFVFAIPSIVRNVTLPLSDDALHKVLDLFFNESTIEAVLQLYPKADFADNDARIARVIRDEFFVCSNRRVARVLNNQGANVYLYHFDYKLDWIDGLILGDYHGSELDFVFNNAWPPILHTFSAKDQQMADVMGTYWTSFAKTGVPAGGSAYPAWPTFSAQTEQNMLLDVPPTVQLDYQEAQCEFWDTVTRNSWRHV